MDVELNRDAKIIVSDWLAELNVALDGRTPERVGALFRPDADWRDIGAGPSSLPVPLLAERVGQGCRLEGAEDRPVREVRSRRVRPPEPPRRCRAQQRGEARRPHRAARLH